MHAMSEDRLEAPAGGRRGELPVLFHLMDVSRQRRVTVAPPAPLSNAAEAQIVEASQSPALPPPPPAIIPTESVSIEPQAAWQPHGNSPAVSPSLASPIPVIADCAPQEAGIPAETAWSPANEPVMAPAPPAPEPPRDITPRSQIASRRKLKTPVSEDWFATHGKFIALAFVVALLGTIYFARTTRKQAAPAKGSNEAPLAEHKLDVQLPAATTTSNAEKGVATSPSGGESSVAVAAAAPKVDLLPPTVSPNANATASTAANAATDAPRSQDNLFVFPSSKSADERVASRPQSTSTGAPPASSASVPTPDQGRSFPSAPPTFPSAPPMPAAYPATSSPALPPHAAPGGGYPPNFAAPPAAPTGPMGNFAPAPPPAQPPVAPPNYRSQFPLPAGTAPPQPQGWIPPPNGGPPGFYQPQDTTARGPRYERTGSGPY